MTQLQKTSPVGSYLFSVIDEDPPPDDVYDFLHKRLSAGPIRDTLYYFNKRHDYSATMEELAALGPEITKVIDLGERAPIALLTQALRLNDWLVALRSTPPSSDEALRRRVREWIHMNPYSGTLPSYELDYLRKWSAGEKPRYYSSRGMTEKLRACLHAASKDLDLTDEQKNQYLLLLFKVYGD